MQCSRRRRRGSSNSHMMRMDRACRLLRKSRFLYALIVGVNFVSSWGSQVANRLEVTEECLATGWLRGGGCGRRAVSGYPTTHNHKPSTQSPTQTHPPTQSPPPQLPPTYPASHPPTNPPTHAHTLASYGQWSVFCRFGSDMSVGCGQPDQGAGHGQSANLCMCTPQTMLLFVAQVRD